MTIEILGHSQRIFLTGTAISEARPGWLTYDVPPLEVWDESLQLLTSAERARIPTADFFDGLRCAAAGKVIELFTAPAKSRPSTLQRDDP